MPTETRKEIAIEVALNIVDQPASTAMSRDSPTPSSRPMAPPRRRSSRSRRGTGGRCRAAAPDRATDADLGVRSSTVASMMFMIPMPPTSSEIEASADHHEAEDPLRPPLLASSWRDDQGEVVGVAV